MSKNWSYKIQDENHPHYGKTLWSGRYCAVTGVLFWVKNPINFYSWLFDYTNEVLDEVYVLIEKRGTGAADFRGKWCMPCGFLECDESGEEGISREFYEETGIKVSSKNWTLFNVQTNPEKCNNGNVTIRYSMDIRNEYDINDAKDLPKPNYKNINGEANEVADVKWIKLSEIDNYEWCFNHDELLKELFSNIFDNIK